MIEEEKWAKIIGSKGYAISNFGNLKSLYIKIPWKKKGMFITRRECVLKQSTNENGYKISHIFVNKLNRYKSLKTHRLVAEYFKLNPNPNKFKIVNHIDGNKLNNHWRNLHWTTSSINNKHAYDKGLKSSIKGSNKWNSKLNEESVKEIKRLIKSMSCREIAILFEVSTQTISDIKFKRKWNHVL